jgi:hypothetical protein
VVCCCRMGKVDSRCLVGLSLVGRFAGFNALMACRGYSGLRYGVRERIVVEYLSWVKRYEEHCRLSVVF